MKANIRLILLILFSLVINDFSVNAQDYRQRTPLHLAAEKGEFETVRLLIENGSDVNAKDMDGYTPLHVASQTKSAWKPSGKGNFDVIKLLVMNGADVNAKNRYGDTPLYSAIESRKLETVKLLIEKGANADSKDLSGGTPLHIAAYVGDLEVVQILIAKGVDVNAKGKDDWTSLHWATTNNIFIELVKLLIEKGANVNAKNKSGYTPLHQVSMKHTLPAQRSIELLIEQGADINAKTDSGMTPLVLASKNRSFKNLQLLIEKGAEVNVKDEDGRTPMHKASSDGNIEIIKYLLSKDANTEIKDNDGNTPLDLAKKNNQQKVIAILTGGKSTDDKNKQDVSKNATILESKDNIAILGEVLTTKGNLVDLKYTQKVFKLGDVLYVFQNGELVGKLAITQILPMKITAKIINTSVTIAKGMSFGKLNEESKNSKKEVNTNSGSWSEYLGEMDWNIAKSKCASIGMRLPTNDELKAAYTKGLTESWKKDGSDYWSITAYDDNRAFIVSLEGGTSNSYSRDGSFSVRCIR